MDTNPTQLITFLVSPAIAEKIKNAAKKEGKPVSKLLREVCEELFGEVSSEEVKKSEG